MMPLKNPRGYRYKGFTLVELILALALVGVLATVVAVGGNQVVARSKDRSAVVALTAVQADAFRVAQRQLLTSESTTLLAFPATETLVSSLRLGEITVTSGPSDSHDTVSVAVVEPMIAVYAASTSSGCLYLVDRLDGKAGWLKETGTCVASALPNPAALNLSADPEQPTVG